MTDLDRLAAVFREGAEKAQLVFGQYTNNGILAGIAAVVKEIERMNSEQAAPTEDEKLLEEAAQLFMAHRGASLSHARNVMADISSERRAEYLAIALRARELHGEEAGRLREELQRTKALYSYPSGTTRSGFSCAGVNLEGRKSDVKALNSWHHIATCAYPYLVGHELPRLNARITALETELAAAKGAPTPQIAELEARLIARNDELISRNTDLIFANDKIIKAVELLCRSREGAP